MDHESTADHVHVCCVGGVLNRHETRGPSSRPRTRAVAKAWAAAVDARRRSAAAPVIDSKDCQ